jgi:hypothetical protein
MIPTIANGQPAAAAYQRHRDGDLHAFGLGVLTVTDTGIARIFVFGGPDLIATFGLPTVLPGTDALPLPTAEIMLPASGKPIGEREAHPTDEFCARLESERHGSEWPAARDCSDGYQAISGIARRRRRIPPASPLFRVTSRDPDGPSVMATGRAPTMH